MTVRDLDYARLQEAHCISKNKKATETIQDVLSHELTDILSHGKGASLLKKFTDELNEYQTEKKGEPREKYKKKIDAQADAEEKLKQLRLDLSDYQNKVDQFSNYKQELDDFNNKNIVEEDSVLLVTVRKPYYAPLR